MILIQYHIYLGIKFARVHEPKYSYGYWNNDDWRDRYQRFP